MTEKEIKLNLLNASIRDVSKLIMGLSSRLKDKDFTVDAATQQSITKSINQLKDTLYQLNKQKQTLEDNDEWQP